MIMRRHVINLFAATVMGALTLFAGGPLYTFNGKAVVYKNVPVTFRTDRGPMGVFTEAEATALAVSSFQVWQDVSTATVAFKNDGQLPVDVDGTNFLNYTGYYGILADGINPIIFDSDGAITDSLFGVGSKEEVIGFAGSDYTDTGVDAGYFTEGESVMNGYFTTRTYDPTHWKFTLAEFKSTFVHEFGHFIGLDHTQLNGDFVSDSSKTKYIPTMYPTSTANDAELATLNPDDIVAISLLYPEPGFVSSHGGIAGAITRLNGAVVRGVNVIAIDRADSLMNVYSTISDYFQQVNGNYQFQGLPAGSYWVKMEPISTDFNGGSSVGPYADDLTGLSFINPVTPEYYNGANESGDATKDNPADRTAITVAVGTTTNGIKIVANSLPGGIVFKEDFEYSAGALLTSSGWLQSGTTSTNPIKTVQPGLSFSGYSSTSVGNSAELVSTGQDVYKDFTPVADGSVYLSFMMKVDSARTGDYFIALSPSTGQTNYFGRVHLISSGSGYLVGLSKSSETTGGAVYGTTVLTLGKTYVVVVRYDFMTGTTTDDILKVYVLGTSLPATEPASAEIGAYVNSKTDAADLGFVTLRQGSTTTAPRLTIDGIRVQTQWPAVTGVAVQASENVPAVFGLEQNFPNPFNPSTTIRFSMPQLGFATLKVSDLLGREVATVANGYMAAGQHTASFNASQIASGVYYYTLTCGTFQQTKKMMLVR